MNWEFDFWEGLIDKSALSLQPWYGNLQGAPGKQRTLQSGDALRTFSPLSALVAG